MEVQLALYLVGSASVDSTNAEKIFGAGGGQLRVDVYYVVRPVMVVSVLNMCRLLFSPTP